MKNYLSNVSTLGMVQVAQTLLPMVTIPYLARVLGPSGYGAMVVAVSTSAFLSSVCDWGFGWTATRDIAAHRDDMGKVGGIFSNVLTSKVVIFAACLAPFLIVVETVPTMAANAPVFLAALLGTLGSVLFPIWLFQGLNRLGVLAAIGLTGRMLSVALIFVLVHRRGDALLAVLLQSGAWLVTGVVALAVARRWVGRNPTRPRLREIAAQLKQAWLVFASTMSINLYTTAQTVLVGAFGGPVSAAYYASAEKCLSAAKLGFGIMSQAAMPHVGYLVRNDPEEGLRFIRKLLLTFPLGLCASLMMFFFAAPLVTLLFGAAYVAGVTPVFRIMAPIPLILNLSTCLSSLYMFHYGYEKQWSFMLFLACVASLLTLLILRMVIKVEQAAAFAILAAETVVLLMSGAYYLRNALAVPVIGTHVAT